MLRSCSSSTSKHDPRCIPWSAALVPVVRLERDTKPDGAGQDRADPSSQVGKTVFVLESLVKRIRVPDESAWPSGPGVIRFSLGLGITVSATPLPSRSVSSWQVG
jgi:hypothetical protein